jgi:L-ascorbate metabolism protein UlaG (beta-lactamase superfamily)
MRIIKFTHSCLYVEADGKAALFDPGHYSWESGAFDLHAVDSLDYIIISHGHEDHMHQPFVRALVEKFPNVTISTTRPAATRLLDYGIHNVITESGPDTELFLAPHESVIPIGAPAENTGTHFMGKFSHPGDSYGFVASKDVLALPITAPAWGTLAKAAELGQRLRPKFAVPIHDWQLNEAARAKAYSRLTKFFEPLGVEFVSPADGVAFEIET